MKRRSFKQKEISCFCNQRAKEQLVAVAGCSNDLAAASALPDNWVPRNSGPILRKFLKDREESHENALNKLTEEAQYVNKDIDGKVRNIAEILLCHIRQNEADIESAIKFKNTLLSKEDRDNAFKQITTFSTQRTEDLLKFKQEALVLERLRADGLRDILKCQFQRLIDIGHKPPRDLLHDFDEKIYEINHQLLSNSRAYIELEAQFRLQLDENILRARSKLNEFCLSAAKNIRGGSTLSWVKQLNFPQKQINNADNDKSRQLKDLEVVKKYITKIVEAYNTACFKVFTEFLDRFDNLYNKINNNNLSICRSDAEVFDKIIEDALDVVAKCNEHYSLEDSANNIIYTHITDLQKKLSSFLKRLYEIYSILTDLYHIWNDHINRSTLVHKFTNLGLEDMQTTQDTLELSNEVNFNIALEQMRCAPDLDKLQQQFDIVTNYINKKSEIYCQQREAENAKFEDFMKLPSIMSLILQSEFYCLLDKHPKVTTVLPETSIIPADPILSEQELLPLRIPLLQALLQTQLQEQEINVCINNYLESFENMFLSISDLIDLYSREWVDRKCSLVNVRSSMKLMSHSVRAERVKAAREARLIELKFHESRLNSHLDAMYNLIDKLPIEASEFSAIDSPELYPFCKWINDIKADIDTLLAKESSDPEFKRLKMSSYALRLLKYRQLFEESLDTIIISYKSHIETDVQKARISNVRFMSRLKLFFESGRYAAAEAIRSCNALVRAGDALESCLHRTMDVLQQRRIQLLALADQQMSPLQRIVDDVYKYGAKSALDKKKLPQNKSK